MKIEGVWARSMRQKLRWSFVPDGRVAVWVQGAGGIPSRHGGAGGWSSGAARSSRGTELCEGHTRMSVPVEGKVGSSPDRWTQIQGRVKGSDSSMLSYLADKSTARTYGWKLTDIKLTSVLVRTWGFIFSSLCRAWNMNISLGRSGWYSRMKQIISLRSAATFATPCFQTHSTCDFYSNYRVFFPNVCFISPNMSFQVRCMAFLRETVLLLGLPI